LAIPLLASSQPTPSNVTKSGLPKIADLALEMALSTYKAHKSVKNYSSLLESLESNIGEHCFPQLSTTLTYSPKQKSANCEKAIELAFSFDAENPVALCARDGFDSRSCQESSESLQIAILSSGGDPWNDGSDIDLDARLIETGTDVEIRQLEANITNADIASRVGGAEGAAILEQQAQSMREAIRLACPIARLSVVDINNQNSPDAFMNDPGFKATLESLPPEDRENYTEQMRKSLMLPTPTPATLSPTSPLDEVEGALGTKKSRISIPKLYKYSRTRFIGSSCDRLTQRAIAANIAKAQGTCARFGKFHPNCLAEMQIERKRELALKKIAGSSNNPKSGTPTPKPKQGLGTF
jgi:hypothetical protein